VQNITSNLTTTTAEANRLMAQLNSQVPGMMSKANSVLNNTSELTAGLNQKLAEVDVATTMAKIDQTLANVNAITEQMNSREGSLGLLLHDPGLYNHLNATMRDADSLLINLRDHPKRYVHFSLFGRKDK
jgi:phospholipid/cholesterol/gamma-HCH transport system substrate-binding protein